MENLQLGDALAGVLAYPAVLAGDALGQPAGNVAVALAKDAEEERPASVDLLQANVEGLLVVGLLPGHTPAQVNIHQVDAVLFQFLAQGGEDNLDEMITL